MYKRSGSTQQHIEKTNLHRIKRTCNPNADEKKIQIKYKTKQINGLHKPKQRTDSININDYTTNIIA